METDATHQSSSFAPGSAADEPAEASKVTDLEADLARRIDDLRVEIGGRCVAGRRNEVLLRKLNAAVAALGDESPARRPFWRKPVRGGLPDVSNGFDAQASMKEQRAPIDVETLVALDAVARGYARGGRWLFALAFVLGLAFAGISYLTTGRYIDDLEQSSRPDQMLVLLLIRGGLFGGLTIGILFAAFSVANAAIDQATRFRKRLYSAHMLNYAFQTFEDEIKEDKVKLAHVVALFSAWNENVDSAFSRVRFQKAGKDVVARTKHGRFGTEEPPDVESRHTMTLMPIVVPVMGESKHEPRI